jgi:hypothetical protein
VFPYYVTQRFGAKSVRAMLEAKETYRWDAFMDKAIPGGFAVRLPEFALYAYNQAPVPNAVGASFAQWDGFAAKPKSVPVVDPRLSGAHARVDPIAVAKDRIMALGREYRRIVVGDASIRQLTFLNPTAANPDLHVRALVKRADGSWRSENWDGRQAVSFCRDQPGQDVREIVLAYSNSGHLMAGQKFAAVKTSVRSEHTCALHYKVLSASINYHTEGAADSIVCGRQSGRITFGAAGGAQAYEPSMSIATRFGQVSGAVRARIPGGWSGHHVEGCTAGPNGLEPCTKDLPPVTPRPDGKADIGFSISGGANDPAWEMHWGMDPPYVGAVDSFDSCMVFISGQVPSSAQVRTVPRATMLQTKPVTLVFKGAMAVPVPVLANGTMSHSWNYTMTIQRVGADGTPLG